MQSDRLTIKSQEALQAAHELAETLGHAESRPLHLLQALARQTEGIVKPTLQRLGADPRAVAEAAERELESYARVEGSEVRPSRALQELLRDAEKVAREFRDDYLSVEHMLLATARGSGAAAEILPNSDR